MSQENEASVPTAPVQTVPIVPVQTPPTKRKRGRPRKDETLRGIQTPAARTPKPAPVKKTPQTNTNPISNGVETMLGQAVSGVLDGSFEAGYLVTVKVANTNTVLRGVVFNPGLVVPISEGNDVASNVKMFKKSEILSSIPSHQNPLNPTPLNSMPPVPQVSEVTHVPLKGVPIDINQAPQASPQALRQAEMRTMSSTTQSAYVQAAINGPINVIPESGPPGFVPVPNQKADSALKAQSVDLNDPPVDFVTAGAIGDLIMKDKAYEGTECASTKMIAELSKIWGENHIQPLRHEIPSKDEGSCLNGRALSEVTNAVVGESQAKTNTIDGEIQSAGTEGNLTSS